MPSQSPPSNALPAPDSDRLRRVARQHAKTAQLLGVDFMPVRLNIQSNDNTQTVAPTTTTPPTKTTTTATPTTPQPTHLINPANSTSTERDARRPHAAKLLDDLRARYEADAPHAAFNTQFTNIVFGEGDPVARLVFVGEAPGADEDRTGRPFVGRAGQLLDKMITAMGLSRGTVYICNVLKTRPPNNATPTSDEAAACAPYLYEQIAIINPDVIVTLGLPATRVLLESREPMGKLRGQWADFTHNNTTWPVMPTYHPAYLLRNYTPEERAKVWSDLQLVIQRLNPPP